MTNVNQPKSKVLLIEDEVILLRMYQEKLEQQGYNVFTAVDGELGIDILTRETPDIVVCDIMMPGTTGLDFLAQKKELHEDIVKIPVIMLTNLDSQDFIQKSEELGAIGYIRKPITDPKDVVKRIEEIMEEHQNK